MLTLRDLLATLGDAGLDLPIVVRLRGQDVPMNADAVAVVAEAPVEHDGALYPGRLVVRLHV